MKFLPLLAAVLAVLTLTACQPTDTAPPSSETTAETSSALQKIADFFTPAPDDDPLIYLAGSDLQHPSGYQTACDTVKSILTAVKDAGYDHADGLFFCGDYNFSFDGSVTSLYTLRKTVEKTMPGTEKENMYLIQGNHDPVDTLGLLPDGASETEDFAVYPIHERDYQWYNRDKEVTVDAAARLETYLNEKIEQNYTKPIFILAHLPLHYSMRTYLQQDPRYACYLFDVINAAAEAGLNIFYLFGHNHSRGFDDYLGGAAIYLAKGDTILVPQSSHKKYNEETLAFTYLNAGYTGYYDYVNKGADASLSMTVFQITDESVTIERYTKDGLHDLKSPGVANDHLEESATVAYEPNTDRYESPQTVPLNQIITP